MGLDVTFFKKTDKGFEDIGTYRNNWEVLNWFKLHKFDEREPVLVELNPTEFKNFSLFPEDIQKQVIEMNKNLGIEDSEYELYPLTKEDIENLVERAETMLEDNPRENKFSDGYVLLARTDIEDMQEWDEKTLNEYIEDLQSYIENLKGVKEDIYISLSW